MKVPSPTSEKHFNIDPPEGLTPREYEAFRIGLLKGIIAMADEFDINASGAVMEAFRHELAFRMTSLVD